MKKILSKWCVEVSIFTITVLTLQVLSEVISTINIGVAVTLGIFTTAILLFAGLWLAKDEDDNVATPEGGRKTAIRAGIGAHRRNAIRNRSRR